MVKYVSGLVRWPWLLLKNSSLIIHLHRKPQMKNRCIILPLLLLFVCSYVKAVEQDIPIIQVAEALESRSEINLSSVVSSLEYVRLETGASTLYRYPRVHELIGDSLILLKTTSRISLFDRRSGGYLKDIGHAGNDDPEGYFFNPTNLGFNPFSKRIYANRNEKEIIGYPMNGTGAIDFVSLPAIDYETGEIMSRGMISSHAFLDSAHFIGYVVNVSGKEKERILIYDRFGKIVKRYPNHLMFDDHPRKVEYLRISFQSFAGNTIFKEPYNDTIFHISLKAIKSAFVMNLDKYGIPYQDRENITEKVSQESLRIWAIMESTNFVFFEVRYKKRSYSGLYEKTTGETQISESKALDYGYTNDVDGFISFKPTFVSRYGEVVSVVSAERIANWFAEHADEVSSLPANIQALRDVEPEDNFIVMIGKLR